MDESEARALLGLAPGASAKEARDAYRRLMRVVHPDRAASDPVSQEAATAAASRLNEAWEVMQTLQQRGERRSQGDSRTATSTHFRRVLRQPKFDECQICGAWPALPIHVTGTKSIVVFRWKQGFDGSACRSCGLAMSRMLMRTSLTVGWWGVGAIFIPIDMVRNVMAEAKLRRMSDPLYRDAHVAALQDFPLSPGPSPFRQPLPIVLTCLALTVLVSVVSGSGSEQSELPSDPATIELSYYTPGNCYAIEGSSPPRLRRLDCSDPNAAAQSLQIVDYQPSCPYPDTLGVHELLDGRFVCLGRP